MYGWKEGHQARFALFNEDGYRAQNPDVAMALNSNLRSGWQHYTLYGLTEGRAAVPAGYHNFSEDTYLAANPDVAAAVRKGDPISGWAIYQLLGKSENRPLKPGSPITSLLQK